MHLSTGNQLCIVRLFMEEGILLEVNRSNVLNHINVYSPFNSCNIHIFKNFQATIVQELKLVSKKAK